MAVPACQFYEYSTIFNMLGEKIREIFINNSDNEKPYPIYESGLDYVSDIENAFKGLLVWNSLAYYAGIDTYIASMLGSINSNLPNHYVSSTVVNSNLSTYQVGTSTFQNDYTVPDVGFFVVPEFGGVNIIPNREYQQMLTISFDTNADNDADPYGSKIIQVIQWFLNKYTSVMNEWEAELPNCGQQLYNFISSVSRPIYSSGLSSYVRRSVTITTKYCRAGG